MQTSRACFAISAILSEGKMAPGTSRRRNMRRVVVSTKTSGALRAIQARVLLMPGDTDLYFRTADNQAELPLLKTASLRPIPSIWGHRAGNPVANPADMLFIQTEVRAWLAQ